MSLIKKKNLDSSSPIFVDTNDTKLLIKSHKEVWDNVKNVHFSTVFSRYGTVIWSHLLKNYSLDKQADLRFY